MAILRVSTLNLKHGGIQTPEGGRDFSLQGQDRWDLTVDAVRAAAPDVLCLQEIHGWREHNHQRLLRAERDFGLRVAGGVPPVPVDPPAGGTLVMYRPEAVELMQWESKESTALRNGMGVCVFDAGGRALSVISVHLPPYDAGLARTEAALAATRALRYGPFGVIAGDVNHFPEAGSPVPDPDEVPPLNRMGRWVRDADGRFRPDRRVAHALSAARLVDAASLVRAPGSAEATGRGGIRVDQVWVSWGVVPGVVSYRAEETGASDHKMVTVEVDVSRFDLEWDAR